MARKPSVTVVGVGSLGSALAIALANAGHRVEELVYRSSAAHARELARKLGHNGVAPKVAKFEQATFSAELIWLCVGDSAIAETAAAMASRWKEDWKGKTVFHSSGALTSDELRPLKRRGAAVASVHPMMTFVRQNASSMNDVWFALEGDPAAVRSAESVTRGLGGQPFSIGKRDKPLYHALGAIAAPLLVSHLAAAEMVGKRLGLTPDRTRKVLAPILRRTLENYLALGPAAALSGPLIRGDVETVRRNLNALNRVKGAEDIYRALARVAVRELPSKNKKELTRLLKRD